MGLDWRWDLESGLYMASDPLAPGGRVLVSYVDPLGDLFAAAGDDPAELLACAHRARCGWADPGRAAWPDDARGWVGPDRESIPAVHAAAAVLREAEAALAPHLDAVAAFTADGASIEASSPVAGRVEAVFGGLGPESVGEAIFGLHDAVDEEMAERPAAAREMHAALDRAAAAHQGYRLCAGPALMLAGEAGAVGVFPENGGWAVKSAPPAALFGELAADAAAETLPSFVSDAVTGIDEAGVFLDFPEGAAPELEELLERGSRCGETGWFLPFTDASRDAALAAVCSRYGTVCGREAPETYATREEAEQALASELGVALSAAGRGRARDAEERRARQAPRGRRAP